VRVRKGAGSQVQARVREGGWFAGVRAYGKTLLNGIGFERSPKRGGGVIYMY
jgi:hypothetical protein